MNAITISEPFRHEPKAAKAPVTPASPEGERLEAAPAAPVQANPQASLLVITAVALAAFASTVSAIGLAVTSRTVAEAHVAIEQIRTTEARHAARVEATPAAAPLAVAARGDAPAPVVAPVTADDIQRMMNSLRGDIARYQTTQGGAPLATTISNGQAELANRLNLISVKLDMLERRISSTRAATPAGDRARPS